HGAGRSGGAAAAPRLALRGLRRALLPAPCGLREVSERAHGRRAARSARDALQLHVRPLPALRVDAGRAYRLRRRPGRSPGRAARAAAARGSAGGLPRRLARRGRARAAARGGRAGSRDHPLPAGGASGRHDVVMALGFDKMTQMIQSSSQTTHPAWLEDAILPAAFFALWATRRMHERGTKPEHLASIAAKNWNNGALNPMSQRQPE